ncbi:MAG: helix-turn-helix domain-containing protein [Lachnospiraceae bacterium]
MGFKERLKEARLMNNMTQEQIADLIGVAKSTFTGYEKGNSEPNMLTVSKIMNVLKVDANFLWQDDTDFPMQVSYEEIKHIEKYRALDPHGQETVSYILEREAERVKQIRQDAEQIKKLTKLSESLHENTTHYVNAAHPIDGASEADKQFDEAIMDDENF